MIRLAHYLRSLRVIFEDLPSILEDGCTATYQVSTKTIKLRPNIAGSKPYNQGKNDTINFPTFVGQDKLPYFGMVASSYIISPGNSFVEIDVPAERPPIRTLNRNGSRRATLTEQTTNTPDSLTHILGLIKELNEEIITTPYLYTIRDNVLGLKIFPGDD